MTSPSAELGSLRVLIVHEWLYAWAGAERVLEQLLLIFPRADLLVGVVTPEMRAENLVARRARETWVGRIPGARAHHRWFLPLHAAAFAAHDTSAYDLVISSSHAFEKFIGRRPGAVHVSYCHSPPRFLWDLRRVYEERGSFLQRTALRFGAPVLRALDRWAASRVDHFVSNSRNVADRVRRHYGRESDVVYPPVSPKTVSLPSEAVKIEPGYLLYIGRLVPYKRVDLVVSAAERLGMRLVVAGDGPEKRRLEALAGKHTQLLGDVSESAAASLLDGCSAFVFAGEEDFGIALVEANAHGRPVVYYNRGGATETMVAGQTGVPFEAQSAESVASAVERCVASPWDKQALRDNAARFSPERFRQGFTTSIVHALASTRIQAPGGVDPSGS